MRKRRFDLVWVKLDGYSRDKGDILAIAPAYSFIGAGQEVVLEEDGITSRATAIMSNNSIELDSEEYKLTLESARTKEPLPRIIKKVDYRDIDWNKDETEEDEDE